MEDRAKDADLHKGGVASFNESKGFEFIKERAIQRDVFSC